MPGLLTTCQITSLLQLQGPRAAAAAAAGAAHQQKTTRPWSRLPRQLVTSPVARPAARTQRLQPHKGLTALPGLRRHQLGTSTAHQELPAEAEEGWAAGETGGARGLCQPGVGSFILGSTGAAAGSAPAGEVVGGVAGAPLNLSSSARLWPGLQAGEGGAWGRLLLVAAGTACQVQLAVVSTT